MATYSPSHKINGAINTTLTAGSTYTAPANGGALINVVALNTGAGGGNMTLNGTNRYLYSSSVGFRSINDSVAGTSILTLSLGPGQSFGMAGSGHAVGTSFLVTGIEYVNT